MRFLRIIISFTIVFVLCSHHNPVIVDQESNCNASLRAISVVDTKTVWVSGSNGTILKTTDGGTSWNKCTIPNGMALDFRGIFAFNADTCIAINAGSPAYILKTCDGGKTWKTTFKDTVPDIFLNSVTFWNHKKGIVAGDPIDQSFVVLITKDSGNSWERISAKNIPPALNGEIQFAASNTCISAPVQGYAWFCTGGPAARTFKTNNWGKTWLVYETPIHKGTQSKGIFSIAFYDSLKGWICGGDYLEPDYNKATLAITTDGGKTWQEPDIFPAGFCSAVAYVPGSKGKTLLSVGLNGINISCDGGISWELLTPEGFHTVSFAPGSATGWAAGTEGRIVKILF